MKQSDYVQVELIHPEVLLVENKPFTIKKHTHSCFLLMREDGITMHVRKDLLMTKTSNSKLTIKERTFLDVKHKKCFDPICGFNIHAMNYTDN